MNGQREYRINFQDVVMRIVKYLLEGIVVAVAAYTIPNGKLDWHEVVTIALVAAAAMSLTDSVSPIMGSSARVGAGLAIGSNIAGGFNRGAPKILKQ